LNLHELRRLSFGASHGATGQTGTWPSQGRVMPVDGCIRTELCNDTSSGSQFDSLFSLRI